MPMNSIIRSYSEARLAQASETTAITDQLMTLTLADYSDGDIEYASDDDMPEAVTDNVPDPQPTMMAQAPISVPPVIHRRVTCEEVTDDEAPPTGFALRRPRSRSPIIKSRSPSPALRPVPYNSTQGVIAAEALYCAHGLHPRKGHLGSHRSPDAPSLRMTMLSLIGMMMTMLPMLV